VTRAHPFVLGAAFTALVDEFIGGRPQVRTAKSMEEYRLAPCAFRAWMVATGRKRFDEAAIKAWLLHRTATATVLVVALQANLIALFVDFLLGRGLVHANPFRELTRQHRALGMRGVVRHLAESRSTESLDARANVPFSGPFGDHFKCHLEHRSALGIGTGMHEAYLVSFERFLRERKVTDLAEVSWSLIDDWHRWLGQTSAYNHRYRTLVLGKFFDFLVDHGVLERSPVHELLPHSRRQRTPRIYSHDEVRRILDAAAALPTHRLLPHRGPTYRLFFLLLYALGLRRNEALDVRLNDIDFEQRSLTIRNGKFHKGRVLPFGPKLGTRLRQYIEGNPLLHGAPRDAFLFPTASHRTPRLSAKSVAVTPAKLLDELKIEAHAETRAPGHHAFRHSFAVHRLERWHREGADIAVKLPLLSAFLGHCDVASTQVYLTMTPERLRLVGESFERAFGAPLPHGSEP
jgi:site-specific recombinase XerD